MSGARSAAANIRMTNETFERLTAACNAHHMSFDDTAAAALAAGAVKLQDYGPSGVICRGTWAAASDADLLRGDCPF